MARIDSLKKLEMGKLAAILERDGAYCLVGIVDSNGFSKKDKPAPIDIMLNGVLIGKYDVEQAGFNFGRRVIPLDWVCSITERPIEYPGHIFQVPADKPEELVRDLEEDGRRVYADFLRQCLNKPR
jgi:hypothetical protein